jgi:hypothetical protein
MESKNVRNAIFRIAMSPILWLRRLRGSRIHFAETRRPSGAIGKSLNPIWANKSSSETAKAATLEGPR